jgi:hypothetical protein
MVCEREELSEVRDLTCPGPGGTKVAMRLCRRRPL